VRSIATVQNPSLHNATILYKFLLSQDYALVIRLQYATIDNTAFLDYIRSIATP